MSELKLFSFIKDKILCFLSITVSFVIKTGCFEPSVSGGVTFLTTPLNLLMLILLFFCLFLVYQNPHERKTKQPLSYVSIFPRILIIKKLRPYSIRMLFSSPCIHSLFERMNTGGRLII